MHDGFKRFDNALTCLGRNTYRFGGIDADHVFDLLGNTVAVRRGQVDLVQDRHDVMIRVNRVIHVGKRLRLYALGTIDNQQRPFDRAHGPRNLVGEIDVTGGVDQIEDIFLAIFGRVIDPHRLGLDRDPALALDIHRIEHLRLHIAQGNGVRLLDQAIGERGFTMIDVGDDGEIADM